MSVTVEIAENRSIRVTEDRIETQPPDRLTFRLEATIALTEGVLDEFAGTTLDPSRVAISLGGSRTVDVDLTDGASLRLSSVDVGVETPDSDELSRGIDALRESATDPAEFSDARPAALAFTVEGTVSGVSAETLEAIAEGDPELAAVTFAIDDPVRGDGGPDALLELTLFGYGLLVRRDGSIVVGSRRRPSGIGPL